MSRLLGIGFRQYVLEGGATEENVRSLLLAFAGILLIVRRGAVGIGPIVGVVHRQVFSHIPGHGKTKAFLFILVKIFCRLALWRRHDITGLVFNPTVTFRRVVADLGTQPLCIYGQIRRDARIPGAEVSRTNFNFGTKLRRRLLGDQADSTGGSVSSKQGALGPAQNLDTLQVQHIDRRP